MIKNDEIFLSGDVNFNYNFFARWRKFFTDPNLVIGPFNVAFLPLISREAPYHGPSVREKEHPGVEVAPTQFNDERKFRQ